MRILENFRRAFLKLYFSLKVEHTVGIEDEVKYRMGLAYSQAFCPEDFIPVNDNVVAFIEGDSYSFKFAIKDAPRPVWLKKIEIFRKDILDAGARGLRVNFAFQEHWTQKSLPPCFSHSRPSGNGNIILWPDQFAGRFDFDHYVYPIIAEDRPWSEKKLKAVWRGASSNCIPRPNKASRLELVLKFFSDPELDVGFSKITSEWEHSADMRKYLRERLSKKEQLACKYIIVVDGNDLPSSLPWVLFSKSLALIVKTNVESIVDYGLEPWVHYVPIAIDYSDLKDKIGWCARNDSQCEKISQNATEHISRLFYARREQKIKRRMLEIYRKNSLQ